MLRPNRDKREKIKLTSESYKKARKLFKYMRPYRMTYMIGWFFLVLSTSIGLIFPLLLGQLLGNTSGSSTSLSESIKLIDLNNVNVVAFALFIMFGAQAVFSYFRVVLFTNVTENTLRDLRNDLFQKLLHLPMNFYNKNAVGDLSSRLSADITQIQETLRTTVAEFFRQLVMIVGGMLIMLFISWKLCLIMLATVPVITVVAVLFGKFIRKLSKEAQDQTAKANAIAEESMSAISNVKSFTNEKHRFKQFNTAVQTIRDLNIKSGIWRGLFISFMVFCMFGAVVFIIWRGLIMTQGPDPSLSPGDLYSFLMITLLMAASIGSLSDFYTGIQKTIGATEKLITIIEERSEQEIHKGTKKPEISGKIAFQNVVFAYPQRKEINVINGLDFSIEQNETLAIVGGSGGGKSTLASLLLNYYQTNSGSILFDDLNQNDIELEHLRKNIAYVPQEVLLFAGSIFENILFGDPTASKDQVIDAAKKANAFDFIESFPDKFETEVGERGVQLSGGQKQRIAIARAILKDPKILILDEATSALDAESEKVVQEALELLMKNRTSIVIAHRLSTIRNANKIIVLKEGKIVEEGKHELLMANNGHYADLIKLQSNLN